MAKKFRLAAVLRVRELIEDRRKREFGGAMGELVRARGERDLERATLAATQDEYNRRAEHATGSIEFLRLWQAYLVARRMELHLKEGVVREVEQEVDRRRNVLMEATRDRKAVEKLHERFLVRRQYEFNREAEKQLAETALNRFVRRKITAGRGDQNGPA